MKDLWGDEISDVPEKRRPVDRTNAERQRRFKARAADIGDIPPVADPARRERGRASLVAFAEAYCMDGAAALLKRAPSPKLREYAETIQAAIEGSGLVHVRFPRGVGKTTWVKAAILWALSYGQLRYVVAFCANAALASAILTDIWNVVEFGEAYGEDFPEVAFPVRAAQGLPQRYGSQTVHGVRTAIRRTASEIRFPTVEGSAASGATILGRGAGSSTRGMVRGSVRPDFVLLDDIQTRKDAESERRRAVLADWVTGDVMGLGGDRLMNVVMTSTPIVAGDLSEQFADKSQHPEWRTTEYRLVSAWPEDETEWQRYDELWREAQEQGDPAFAAATAWYAAHRETMDAGVETIDPGNFDARLELSAVQHARNLLLSMGPEAFGAEYQLKTRTAAAELRVSPLLVASRVNGFPDGTLPPGVDSAVAFLDVNAADGISWSVVGFGPGQTAAVVGYGRFPGHGRRLVPEGATERDIQAGVAAGVAAVLDRLLAARFMPADGGREASLVAVWVDVGYEQDAVLRTCARYRAMGFHAVHGCKGVSAQRYNPRGRHVVRRALGVDFRRVDKAAWFMQVSDIWKERVQRAFLAPPLARGSLSLFGAHPGVHRDFSAEICAEVLADKVKDSRGVDWYKWNMKPGARNHWLDTTSGCFAMASWYRLLDDGETVRTALAAPVAAATPDEGADEDGAAATVAAPSVQAPAAAAPMRRRAKFRVLRTTGR